MKASKFVSEVKDYLDKNDDLNGEICYPYCDLYGFVGIESLKGQIILIPEEPETPYYDKFDQFPDSRLNVIDILDLIQKEIDENGDRDLYYETFDSEKEPVNHWQTTYRMIVPMYLEDINE